MKKLQFSKISILLFLLVFVMYSCSSSSSLSNEEDVIVDVTINPISTAYDITPILSYYDNIAAVSYVVNGNTVTFTSKGVPNHTSPYWDTANSLYEAYNGTNSNWRKNPNSIGEQNLTFTITLNPCFSTKCSTIDSISSAGQP